jgi:HSP20 family molecular chaperone IbpA
MATAPGTSPRMKAVAELLLDFSITYISQTALLKGFWRTIRKGRRKKKELQSYRSFHRRIPFPEEIMPSKIDAKMNNGILKKIPTKAEEEASPSLKFARRFKEN